MNVVDVPGGPGDDGRVKLVRVYETATRSGLLVRGLLEAEGIDVLAKGEGPALPDGTRDPVRAGRRVGSRDELIAASEDGSLALDPARSVAEEALATRRLALRVLRSLPSLLQPVLATLLLPRVAPQEPFGLQLGSELRVELEERAGDAEPQARRPDR